MPLHTNTTVSTGLQEQLFVYQLIPDSTKAEIETFDFKCSLETINQMLESIMGKIDDDDMRSELDNLGVSESKLHSELEAVSYEDLMHFPTYSTGDSRKMSTLKRSQIVHTFRNILHKKRKSSLTHQREKISPWIQQFSKNGTDKNDVATRHVEFVPPSSVSFSSVEVREYSLTLGDHPDCSDGPPISLDWSHINKKTVSVDYYENHRGRHKTLTEMKMETTERQDFLQKEAGFSATDIQEVEKEMARIRKQRRVTRKLSLYPARQVEETFASAKRKMVRVVCGKRDVCIALEQGRLVNLCDHP